MKKTIAILLVAIMAVGSVFAAVTGEASLGAGLNFDNGNYGFIDSGAKVKIDVDLATADAEAIAEGDVYASVKASFGLKVYSGEKNISEIEDPSFAGDKWKVGLTADITEAMIAGANWSVSILGLDGAPNYAKGFQTYTVKKGIDKWGFERNDFDEQYSIDSNFDKSAIHSMENSRILATISRLHCEKLWNPQEKSMSDWNAVTQRKKRSEHV